MSRIDYSKWDKLEDSDEEETAKNGETALPHYPRVTKLDEPSRVTTQVDGSVLVQPEAPSSPSLTPSSSTSLESSKLSKNRGPDDHSSIPSSWTEKGACVSLEDGTPLWWCQDRYSVTLRVLVGQSKTYQVDILGALSYEDRHVATGSAKPHLVVRCGEKKKTITEVWWEDDLPHAVHLEEGEDDQIDWSILPGPQGQRYLTISLYKAVPMAGLFVWWKQPLLHSPERIVNETGNAAFQEAWKQAHEHFRAQRRAGEMPHPGA